MKCYWVAFGMQISQEDLPIGSCPIAGHCAPFLWRNTQLVGGSGMQTVYIGLAEMCARGVVERPLYTQALKAPKFCLFLSLVRWHGVLFDHSPQQGNIILYLLGYPLVGLPLSFIYTCSQEEVEKVRRAEFIEISSGGISWLTTSHNEPLMIGFGSESHEPLLVQSEPLLDGGSILHGSAGWEVLGSYKCEPCVFVLHFAVENTSEIKQTCVPLWWNRDAMV